MEDRFVRRVAVGAFVIWLVWFIHPFLAARMMIPWKPETVGQWGDTFGALNALMSTLAFAAVFYTLRLQQRQIADAQSDTHRQRFENTFFEMLKMIREAREEVRFVHTDEYLAVPSKLSKNVKRGHAAFRAAYQELRYRLHRAKREENDISKAMIADFYVDYIHNRYESTLGAYYRLIYGALDRIRNDPYLSDKDKDSY